MEKQGRFIVLEGLEGAGKSTALSTVKRTLEKYVTEIIVTREPGGTGLGESIRDLLKNPRHELLSGHPIDPRAELLLFYAARVQLIENVIKPALKRGAWVIADRFELSTFAYQGGGRGLPILFLKELSHYLLKGFQPDMTLFLDISPALGLQRAAARGQMDRIEAEPLAFFERVYQAYHAHLPRYTNVHCIDASCSLGAVMHTIRSLVQQFAVNHINATV